MRLGFVWLMLPLVVACSQPEVSTERKQMMLSDDPGAVALGAYCGACHAAPLPMRHTMAEWSPVVARMELHRLQRGFDPIPANDRAALLGFLQAGE